MGEDGRLCGINIAAVGSGVNLPKQWRGEAEDGIKHEEGGQSSDTGEGLYLVNQVRCVPQYVIQVKRLQACRLSSVQKGASRCTARRRPRARKHLLVVPEGAAGLWMSCDGCAFLGCHGEREAIVVLWRARR